MRLIPGIRTLATWAFTIPKTTVQPLPAYPSPLQSQKSGPWPILPFARPRPPQEEGPSPTFLHLRITNNKQLITNSLHPIRSHICPVALEGPTPV